MQHPSHTANTTTINHDLDLDLSAIPEYAEVAIPLRVMQTFTYRLPVALRTLASTGARVIVPFGNRELTGYVVDLHQSETDATRLIGTKMKSVQELLDYEPLITPGILKITRWVADYYAAPWGEVLKAALPSGLNVTQETILRITQNGQDEVTRINSNAKPNNKTRVLRVVAEAGEISLRVLIRQLNVSVTTKDIKELERLGWLTLKHQYRPVTARAKQRKAVRLLPIDKSKTGGISRRLTTLQQQISDSLAGAGGTMALAELLQMTKASVSSVRALEARGILEVFVRDVRRDPLAGQSLPTIEEFDLTPAQSAALVEIEAAIESESYSAFLLHGITGSGKTEIYIRAMRATLNRGKTALMLVPEIALTPVFSRRLRACFGDQIAIFHSSLSTGERFDEWNRLKRGEARIVIGTRSAVFAPVSNLGLVVVDEEHETSYRQHESPYYHARDTAIVRARLESAVVLLGSATPSLESFQNAQTGKYRYLPLPNRIANRALATAELVDMRKVFAENKRAEAFSDQLLDEIEATFRRGEQSMILLNRRGFSSFVLCRSCGESIHCPNCDVTLTYHRADSALICHYCNHRQRAPQACPACNGKYIYYVGEGTEQIEVMLRSRFPSMRIARLDRDTTSRKKLYEKVVMEFGACKLDMLVGTQMLAKGHDFPNVTLVGVVSVDAGLSLPDFRSAERTFQLITQVAGRAGRGDRTGRVLIQTYHPQHYALRHACNQDYSGFFAEEIRYRRSLNYPPFVSLASILVHGKAPKHVMETSIAIRKALDDANEDRHCRVLGPAPAPLARLKGEYRRQLLIKSQSRTRLRNVIDNALRTAEEAGCDMHSVDLEIDPVDMM